MAMATMRNIIPFFKNAIRTNFTTGCNEGQGLKCKEFFRTISSGHLFVEPCSKSEPDLTIQQVIKDFQKTVGFSEVSGSFEQDKHQFLESRKKLLKYLPSSQDELPPRKMEDSFLSVIVPLGEDLELREKYRNHFGTVRIGRLLEDLDVFAVWCCFKHIFNPAAEGSASPYSVVTALVDSIQFGHRLLQPEKNLRLSGHVSWTGQSSIEVCILVDQKNDAGEFEKALGAVFVFVARDPLNKKKAYVNRLDASTEAELDYVRRAAERNKIRKEFNLDMMRNSPPTAEERELIHNLLLNQGDGTKSVLDFSLINTNTDSNVALIRDSTLNTLLLCHPQYRNRYGKIFGGFIMRQAFELAHTNTCLFAKTRPTIFYMDDILFREPVEVGSVLRFRSAIAYVEDNYIHSPVEAEVVCLKTGVAKVTNVFQFTFKVAENTKLKRLIPGSYQESLTYLDARRHFRKIMGVNK